MSNTARIYRNESSQLVHQHSEGETPLEDIPASEKPDLEGLPVSEEAAACIEDILVDLVGAATRRGVTIRSATLCPQDDPAYSIRRSDPFSHRCSGYITRDREIVSALATAGARVGQSVVQSASDPVRSRPIGSVQARISKLAILTQDFRPRDILQHDGRTVRALGRIQQDRLSNLDPHQDKNHKTVLAQALEVPAPSDLPFSPSQSAISEYYLRTALGLLSFLRKSSTPAVETAQELIDQPRLQSILQASGPDSLGAVLPLLATTSGDLARAIIKDWAEQDSSGLEENMAGVSPKISHWALEDLLSLSKEIGGDAGKTLEASTVRLARRQLDAMFSKPDPGTTDREMHSRVHSWGYEALDREAMLEASGLCEEDKGLIQQWWQRHDSRTSG